MRLSFPLNLSQFSCRFRLSICFLIPDRKRRVSVIKLYVCFSCGVLWFDDALIFTMMLLDNLIFSMKLLSLLYL